MSDTITLKAIGRVVGGRQEPIDDDWDEVEAVIALDAAQFNADATAGLGEFSHVEVVFHFDRVGDDEINTGARHPRGRTDWPRVGIFNIDCDSTVVITDANAPITANALESEGHVSCVGGKERVVFCLRAARTLSAVSYNGTKNRDSQSDSCVRNWRGPRSRPRS